MFPMLPHNIRWHLWCAIAFVNVGATMVTAGTLLPPAAYDPPFLAVINGGLVVFIGVLATAMMDKIWGWVRPRRRRSA